MAYVDNSETAKELVEAIRGNANTNLPPKILANQIMPVIDINPKHGRRANICRSAGRTAASSTTIYTTPSDKDFFLTSIIASYAKDALNDHASGSCDLCTATIDGASQIIARFAALTLTAQQGNINLTFNNPIKIDRNTAISLAAVTIGAGTFARAITISGYTVEP